MNLGSAFYGFHMAEGDFIQPATFKARYTEFSSLEDATIDVYLSEARLHVGNRWPETARAKAQGLVVAHQLTIEGKASGASGSLSAAQLDGISELQIEEFLTVKYEDKTSAQAADADLGPFGGSRYGQEFLALRDQYFGGGMVV